jgi:hypothetical protein
MFPSGVKHLAFIRRFLAALAPLLVSRLDTMRRYSAPTGPRMYSCQAVPAAVTRDPGTVHSYSTHLAVNRIISPSPLAANLIRADLLL